MEMPVKSKVDEINLRPHEFMLPIFELVVNALISISNNGQKEKGLIRITIERDEAIGLFNSELLVDKEGNIVPTPIKSVSVNDNGIGFNEVNFKSFNTAYSEQYRSKGCKGVGRFTMLACFEKMTVQSIFQQAGRKVRRCFTFDVENEVSLFDLPPDEKLDILSTGSIVTLTNFLPKFKDRSSIPAKEIAKEIIEHCLPFFYQQIAPTVVLEDNSTKEKIVLNDEMRQVISFEGEPQQFNLKDQNTKFDVLIVKRTDARVHRLLLCAHSRVVGKAINLARLIPGLESSFHTQDGQDYCVDVYVQSDYLNSNVNTVRNSFNIPTTIEDGLFEEVSIEKILAAVSDILKTKYAAALNVIHEKTLRKVRQYILNPKKPRLAYRSLLNKPDLLKGIPSNASDETIEEHLHKIKFALEKDLTRKVKKALKRGTPENPEEYSEIVKGILSQEAEFTKDKLADLLIQRKAVLGLFRKMIKLRDGEYRLEEDVHNIIFPMGHTNDTLPYEYHNLWLLDERLAFYSFIASDKTLKSNPVRAMSSGKEPDLLFFDFPWAFSDSESKMNSMVIFEFKRPGRDMNTAEDRNLDSQIMEYFMKLMESKAKDYSGEFVNLEKTTPKFGYIICDLHRELVDHNIDFNQFSRTPFGTLYKHNDKINLHIEAMTYKQMIDMSEQRHQAFFKELGMDED